MAELYLKRHPKRHPKSQPERLAERLAEPRAELHPKRQPEQRPKLQSEPRPELQAEAHPEAHPELHLKTSPSRLGRETYSMILTPQDVKQLLVTVLEKTTGLPPGRVVVKQRPGPGQVMARILCGGKLLSLCRKTWAITAKPQSTRVCRKITTNPAL